MNFSKIYDEAKLRESKKYAEYCDQLRAAGFSPENDDEGITFSLINQGMSGVYATIPWSEISYHIDNDE